MTVVKIGPGEHYVTRKPGDVIATVLGSCICACIRDPLAGIGGMNHFMLPESSTGQWGARDTAMRYGNFAMARLIDDILCGGGARDRLEIKIFGGASMVGRGGGVGTQNADFVEQYLLQENLLVAARHLRGSHARRINYWPLAGIVRMLEMPLETHPLPTGPCTPAAAAKPPINPGRAAILVALA